MRTHVTAAADLTTRSAGPAGSPRPSAVVVAGLRKSYGAVQAVRGASFAVGPGEIFALLHFRDADSSAVLNRVSGALPVLACSTRPMNPFAQHAGWTNLGALLTWGAAGALVAVRRFRWDPRPE